MAKTAMLTSRAPAFKRAWAQDFNVAPVVTRSSINNRCWFWIWVGVLTLKAFCMFFMRSFLFFLVCVVVFLRRCSTCGLQGICSVAAMP